MRRRPKQDTDHPRTDHPWTDHPNETELLFLLDGELISREARPIRSHLLRCRECRGRMKTLQEGLRAFAEYASAISPGVAPNGWSEFAALLECISSTGERTRRSKAS